MVRFAKWRFVNDLIHLCLCLPFSWQALLIFSLTGKRSMKFQRLSALSLIVVLLAAGLVTSTTYRTTVAVTEAPTLGATAAASGETIPWAFVPSENSQTVLDSAQPIAD